MEVDGSQWLELVETLVTIKVAMAKGCSHAHRLLTSVRTIHKSSPWCCLAKLGQDL